MSLSHNTLFIAIEIYGYSSFHSHLYYVGIK